jgi:hypothetical protein
MSFRSSSSVENLRRHAKLTSHYTKELTKEIFIRTSNFSIFFSLFLANSKGKDKFIALFQYLFEFACACGKHSNIPEFAAAYTKSKMIFTKDSYQIWSSTTISKKASHQHARSSDYSDSSTKSKDSPKYSKPINLSASKLSPSSLIPAQLPITFLTIFCGF